MIIEHFNMHFVVIFHNLLEDLICVQSFIQVSGQK